MLLLLCSVISCKKAGHETGMFSTFPQECMAFISWEMLLRKKKIAVEDSLEEKKILLDSSQPSHFPSHGMLHVPGVEVSSPSHRKENGVFSGTTH